MIEMMAANAVIPEQKKRGASSCANITKYFSPPPPATVKVAESLPNTANTDAIPEYFKRSCGPLDLSQPGHVYTRPPMHDTAGSSGGGHPMDLPTPKWPQMRDDHGCGESMVGVSMERIERQIFQELDSRMCQELDESKETDEEDDDEEDEDSEGQEMYENSLSMKYNREMKQRYDPHHAMYAMADAMKPEAIMVDKGGAPSIANAFNMMLSNSRAALGAGARNDVVSRVDKPSCGDCLYSEPPPHAYKWVPDLNPPMDDYKMPVNEVKDPHPQLEAFIASAEQQTQVPPSVSAPLMSPVTSAATKPIVSTATTGVPSASGYPSSREISLPPQPRPPADEQSVEVISYEDFLKSDGITNKEKPQPEEPPPPPPPPPPPVETVVKRQSNIRRFFTRVPRTVEVKFDHKRLVTVTAVVHPQPQSPHKLPLKKTNARKHSPRRATKKQLSDTHGNAGKQGYNTRRHKSNVVVDTEEIDLTIKEMNADVMSEEGPKAWRPIRRRLRGSGNVSSEDKITPDASCQKNGIADDSSFTFRTGKNLNKSSYKFTGKKDSPKVQTRELPQRSGRPKRFQLREGSSDEEDHERPVGRSISYTFPKRTLRPRYEAMPTTTLTTAAITTTTTTTTTASSCRKSARLNPKPQEPKAEINPYSLDTMDDGETSSSHQPLKSIYTTTVVQPDASNSLRLKFTRIGKKHHHHRRHHHHHHHPYQRRHKKHKSAKVQKAMQLLQRAKESSIMRDPRQEEDDNVIEDEDQDGLRRSSRRSSVVVRKAMEGAARAEEMRQARITAQRQTPPRRTKQLRLRQQMKSVPERRPPGRPPTRSANPVNRGSVVSGFSSTRGPVKLASIFTKRVPAPAKRTSPIKRAKSVVDAAAAKARQDFLNSSIPESMQQKLNRSQVLAQQLEEDYSPFPHTSHVQQLSEDEQKKLKEEATAPKKFKVLSGDADELASPLWSKSKENLHLGSLTSISGKVSECYKSQIYQLASFNSSLKPLPPIAIRQSLADIALRFPKFPAIKLFRRYKNKRKRMEELEETMWADQEKESLSAKRPAEVIDLDDNEEGKNGEKRQKTEDSTDTSCTQRHSPIANKDKPAEVVENTEVKTSQNSGQQGKSSWLWTDKYQPTHSADVIGNSKPVGHLRQWLLEWRERCKWAAKHGLDGKSGRKGRNKGSWSEEDDSDFIISGGEDDSSSDGSRLCNTMLLTGPSGVGKTAAVYALAEELGFKVLEVNASSRRMGKQVLTQLQEATQSHQILAKGKQTKQFFQTPAAKKEHKDKICWNEAIGCNSSLQDEKGPAGVSLVLFEDLDLVFDDDDGFCQAVNTFMSTTKRPIILTSSVDNVFVTSKIKGHFEELKFRVPNTSVTASYLQVLCLAENLQTDFKDVLSLVEHNRGDVRQTLLSLQYWACSGGDALAREEANSLPPAPSEGSDKQDEKPERKASVIVENLCEDSMGNDLFETLRNADLPQDEVNSTEAMLLDETSALDTLPQRLPYAHTGCLESIRALRVFPHRSLCHALQASDLKTLASLVEQCHQLDIVLTLSNLPHLLQMPTNPSSASISHKGPSLNIVWHVEEDPPIAETRGDSATNGPPAVSKAKPPKTPFEREAVPQALSALSRLHDNLSVLDSTFSHVLGGDNEESSSCWKWWYREPQDGLLDDLSEAKEEMLLPHMQETGAYIEAATLRTCSRSLQQVMRHADFQSHKDCFTLPIVHQFLCRDNGMEPSVCRQRKLDNETVCDHLTSVMQVNRHKLTSDYLPYVRAICAAEKLRQATNRKRGGRFLHYLDSMALPSSVLGRLSEEFP